MNEAINVFVLYLFDLRFFFAVDRNVLRNKVLATTIKMRRKCECDKRMKTLFVLACVCVSSAVAQTDELDDLMSTFAANRSLHEQHVNRTSALVMKTMLNRILCVQQGFTHLECLQCFSPNHLVSALNATSSSTTVEQLSVMVLNKLLTFRSVCTLSPPNGCDHYDECRDELHDRLLHSERHNPLDAFEDVLRLVKAVYQPAERKQCFSAESALKELQVTPEDEKFTEKFALVIVRNLLEGRCIDVGEAVTDFMDDLLHRYGDKNTQTITSNGLSKLLLDLKIGGLKDHDHEHHHHNHNETGEDHKDNHIHEEEHDHNHGNHEHHHPHDDHDHENETVTSLQLVTEEPSNVTDNSVLSHRQKRHQEHEHGSLASKCLSPELLFQKFSHSTEGLLTQSEFMQLCPALIQQHVSRVCALQPQVLKTKEQKLPDWQLYLYGSIAVLIISLCSLVVVIILPVMGKSIYPYLMAGLIGVAYGTMSGDAMLHLIPQVLELHSHGPGEGHDHEEHDHHHPSKSHEHGEVDFFWKQMGILITIYVIFLFETILGMMTKTGAHDHNHSLDKDLKSIDVNQENKLKNKTESNIELTSNSSLSLNAEESEKNGDDSSHFDSPTVCFGLKAVALVVTVGDTIHNFGDGLAIGAAFAGSAQGGISTSLAVFCHELPHEFGDFVILLSTGLSFKKALLINFLSALSCFVGLYIGIPLGEDRDTRLWVLTITAGIFLYVALVEMLPELKSNHGRSKMKMFLTKNVGVIAGTASMVLIGLFEDKIHI